MPSLGVSTPKSPFRHQVKSVLADYINGKAPAPASAPRTPLKQVNNNFTSGLSAKKRSSSRRSSSRSNPMKTEEEDKENMVYCVDKENYPQSASKASRTRDENVPPSASKGSSRSREEERVPLSVHYRSSTAGSRSREDGSRSREEDVANPKTPGKRRNSQGLASFARNPSPNRGIKTAWRADAQPAQPEASRSRSRLSGGSSSSAVSTERPARTPSRKNSSYQKVAPRYMSWCSSPRVSASPSVARNTSPAHGRKTTPQKEVVNPMSLALKSSREEKERFMVEKDQALATHWNSLGKLYPVALPPLQPSPVAWPGRRQEFNIIHNYEQDSICIASHGLSDASHQGGPLNGTGMEVVVEAAASEFVERGEDPMDVYKSWPYRLCHEMAQQAASFGVRLRELLSTMNVLSIELPIELDIPETYRLANDRYCCLLGQSSAPWMPKTVGISTSKPMPSEWKTIRLVTCRVLTQQEAHMVLYKAQEGRNALATLFTADGTHHVAPVASYKEDPVLPPQVDEDEEEAESVASSPRFH